MSTIAGGPSDVGGLLRAVEASAPVDAVDVLAARLGAAVGARHVSLLIANFTGDAVVRLSHVAIERDQEDGRNERVESLPLPGSLYEQAMCSQQPVVAEEPGGWLVLVPVTERGDAIGLLELSLSDRPDGATAAELSAAARAMAYVLIASRRHTDLFEWAQRDLPFSLAAEIQRRLLPAAYTLESPSFTIAGWLEPAHDVGGDTFDYSLDREHLHASITDAMGHGVESAVLATITVSSFRNSRRALASAVEQADIANAALLEVARPDQFVTGQVLRIRLADGITEIVNAGHPPPYLLRAGEAAEVDLAPGLALGIDASACTAQTLTLEPGDRLLLVTDGFLERNAVHLDLADILVASADLHPREVVRQLAGSVMLATGGALQDDATAVCIDWCGIDS